MWITNIMQGLNTYQIYDILSQDPDVGPHFGGVYARNTLPSTSIGQTFVLNTDPASEPGEHWVCIYIDPRTGIGEYFDSYGFPPLREFERFMASRCRQMTYNPVCYQSDETSVCGHYCIYFLKKRSQGLLNPFQILPYPKTPRGMEKLWNDRYVYQWFRRRYQIPPPVPPQKCQKCRPRRKDRHRTCSKFCIK